MSSETLQQNAGQIKPGDKSPSGKLLGCFADLPENIEPTKLTQEEIMELIADLLSVLKGHQTKNDNIPEWRMVWEPPCYSWTRENWEILKQDPIGKINWPVQVLSYESVRGE